MYFVLLTAEAGQVYKPLLKTIALSYEFINDTQSVVFMECWVQGWSLFASFSFSFLVLSFPGQD